MMKSHLFLITKWQAQNTILTHKYLHTSIILIESYFPLTDNKQISLRIVMDMCKWMDGYVH